ncbi:hypothetical protein HPP92_003018 [Vanilla planifolia]|uniref:Uncharacterized protein n=1 Tax=Vanilla planifolia TaxID=51239 RepID=A0A835S6C9_VANPL|nr:hypothetical protein HPP92_003018 [Vanilla planifolia]
MLIHWLHKLIGARCSFKGFEAAVGTLSSDLRNLATRKDTAPTPFPPMEEAWFLGPTFSGLGMAPPKVTLPEPASPPTRSAGRTRTARDAWMQTSSPQSMPPSTTASTSFLSPSVARPCDQQKDLRGESVGNSGPELGKVENVALWLLTVGARTIDREFPAFAIFGEHRLKGESLSDASLPRNKMLPLIHSHDAAAASETVLSWRKGEVVKLVGGKGMILVNNRSNGDEIFVVPHFLRATHISYSDGLKLFSYLDSTKSPKGTISYPFTMLGTQPTPSIALFLSRGSNTFTLEILKPNIVAPRVNIIATYTKADSLTGFEFDKRRLSFNFELGKSMSFPHITNIISLLKALHLEWSPFAIK